MNKQKGSVMVVGLLVGLGLLVALAVGGLSFYGYANSLRSEGIGMETQLNAQYLDNQNELSAFISSFNEQVGVANLKTKKMHDILVDAVKGRYESKNGNVGYGKGSPLFSAIVEAYPDLKGTDTYDKVIAFIASAREAYKGKQSNMIDRLRNYDKWRKDGIVQSQIVSKVLKFPSESLEARIGTDVKRGQEALDQMYVIVLASDARNAYKSGTMEPLKVPKD